MQRWKIKYYTTPVNLSSPVFAFIDSLSESAQAKVYQSFELLAEFNILLRPPLVKKLAGTPLWELRILGKDSIRIFYIAQENQEFLVQHCFVKKKQKTPIKEIQLALKRLNEHMSRK